MLSRQPTGRIRASAVDGLVDNGDGPQPRANPDEYFVAQIRVVDRSDAPAKAEPRHATATRPRRRTAPVRRGAHRGREFRSMPSSPSRLRPAPRCSRGCVRPGRHASRRDRVRCEHGIGADDPQRHRRSAPSRWTRIHDPLLAKQRRWWWRGCVTGGRCRTMTPRSRRRRGSAGVQSSSDCAGVRGRVEQSSPVTKSPTCDQWLRSRLRRSSDGLSGGSPHSPHTSLAQANTRNPDKHGVRANSKVLVTADRHTSRSEVQGRGIATSWMTWDRGARTTATTTAS